MWRLSPAGGGQQHPPARPLAMQAQLGPTKEQRSSSLPTSSSSTFPSSSSVLPSSSSSSSLTGSASFPTRAAALPSTSSSPSTSSPTSSFSPTLLTLLDQLTPSLLSASPPERVRVLLRALQEAVSVAVLYPSSQPSPPPTPTASPLPSPSPSSTSASVSGAAAPFPMRLPPPSTSAAPSSFSSSSYAVAARRSASLSLPSTSLAPLPSSSSPSSTPVLFFSSLRGVCDLLLLSYIDALSRASHSPSPSSLSPSSSAEAAAVSSAGSSLPLPSIPPSPSTLSFLSLLSQQPHFATTHAFSCILQHFTAAGGRGLLFLVEAALAHGRMKEALSFIAAHALSHVTPALTACLVASASHHLLLSTVPGSAIFRCLPSSQRLELLLLLLLSPLPSLSSLLVLSALDELLPHLDVHGLYRVSATLDPHAGTVPLSSLDNFARILVVELHITAIILIRAKAVERETQQRHREEAGQRAAASVEVAVDGEFDGSDGPESDAEELGFFTAERLLAALLAHRGGYRQWRIIAQLLDHGHAAAVAQLHEHHAHWTDAFELRIALARQQHAMHADSSSTQAAEAQQLLLQLLRTHIPYAPSEVERARLLGLLALAWRDCGLRAELLEAEWISGLERWADALCILVFAQPRSLADAIPAWSSSGPPPAFSPLLRLHLTSHRLQRLHSSHSSSLSSSLPVASPRLWHEVLSRMQATAAKRSHLSLHTPPAALDSARWHDDEDDELAAFTCDHSLLLRELREVQLPQLLTRLRGLEVEVDQLSGWLEAEYSRELMRVACPTCVWGGLQAEASRLAHTVARVVQDGAVQHAHSQQGAAHHRGAYSGAPHTTAGRVHPAATAAAPRRVGGGSAGGTAAAAMDMVQRSPGSSPTSTRVASATSTPRDRAAKLETWR